MVNIGSTSVGGRVLSVKTDTARLSLTMPVCTLEKEKVALSRRIEGHWRCVWGCVCVCVRAALAPCSAALPRIIHNKLSLSKGQPDADETFLCLDL